MSAPTTMVRYLRLYTGRCAHYLTRIFVFGCFSFLFFPIRSSYLAIDPLLSDEQSILLFDDFIHGLKVFVGDKTETSWLSSEFVIFDHWVAKGAELGEKVVEFSLSDILRKPSYEYFFAIILVIIRIHFLNFNTRRWNFSLSRTLNLLVLSH